MSKGSTNAEKAKWRSMRATPRKLTPGELHQRAVARRDAKRISERYALDMRKATAAGDYSRKNKARWARRDALHRGVRKNAELGIAPVYRGIDRDSNAQLQWLKHAREWDRANPAA